MRHLILAGVVLLASIGTARAHELDVVNKSRTSIHHLYLSPVKADEWGPDQFGDRRGDTVDPGETFTLTGIERGRYDVKLIAEDDTECVVESVSFNESKEWVITERMLDDCAS
ncbi:MAG: hypothetical protein GXC76_05610 [Rhodanobacteraceae bacterium]|jgi:hypothetical protein|nr:hypothetical protein [Rhodanobacteraceae bacterium]